VFILTLVAFGVLFDVLVTGCALESADFDKDLIMKSDGMVYRIGEQKPYTGKAYQTVCGYDTPCGFFKYSVHWRGEFKDGRRDGIFEFPRSRCANDFFCPGDEDVARVRFIRGVEQGETHVNCQ
jgi:hypothetical protein